MFNWEEHGAEVQGWYHEHGLGDMPYRTYPDTGYIIPNLAAMWVYDAANAPMSFFAYHIINPKKVAMGLKALEDITEFAEEIARVGGSKFIFQSLQHSALKNIADLKNYTKGDTNITHYWKEV